MNAVRSIAQPLWAIKLKAFMTKLYILIVALFTLNDIIAQNRKCHNLMPSCINLTCLKYVNTNPGYAVGWEATIF